MRAPRPLTVTVDAVVLHGIAIRDADALCPAVTQRLAALLAARGLPGRDAAAAPVPHGAEAPALAQGIAEAIWAALPGGGR